MGVDTTSKETKEKVEAQKRDPAADPVPGYEALGRALVAAYDQAARGKGKERHAGPGEAFTDQVILQGARRFGTGALLFQAYKKAEESQRLPYPANRKELLGAIVYLAAAVIRTEEQANANGA
jgi:hypothetical protein